MQYRAAIVILNYRTADLTIDCLESLEGQAGNGIVVLAVDNDSRDGSAERIEHAIKERGFGEWARVLRSPENGGFAAGNNFGIRSVHAGAYVLLNSDTIVKPGAIAALLRAMDEHPNAGLIGPSFENGSGDPDLSTFRDVTPISELVRSANTGPITKLFSRFATPAPNGHGPAEYDWIGFACVLVRREVIDRVGLLDEGYFMYFEDIDYCRRVRDAGFTVLQYPAARVVHLLGGSSKVTSETRKPAPRYYYEARARYFAKFHGRPGLWLANVLFDAGHLVSRGRDVVQRREPAHRPREPLDVWINAWEPFRPSSARPRAS
jgi:GT2 family glycosyltransferase